MGEVARVRTRDLLKVLRSVLPMVDREPGLAIHAALIETGGGVLTATGTDRFVLGHARATCEGELPAPLLVWRKGVKRLIRALADEETLSYALLSVERRGGEIVRLTLGSEGSKETTLDLIEEWGFDWIADVACQPPAPLGALAYPGYSKLFEAGESLDRPLGIQPAQLAKFCKAADEGRPFGQVPRWRALSPKKIRVDIGDWFAGLAATYPHLTANERSAPVSVGLPEADRG